MHLTDLTLTLPDETATIRLGAALAEALQTGMVVFFSGNLGAGKTTLIRALLRARGISGSIKSPTYTLVEPYVVSNLYFYHFDLYRFTDPEEWWDAGFPDYFNDSSVALIEWPEQAAGALPSPDWHITLQAAPHGGREFHLRTDTEKGRICLHQLLATHPTLP